MIPPYLDDIQEFHSSWLVRDAMCENMVMDKTDFGIDEEIEVQFEDELDVPVRRQLFMMRDNSENTYGSNYRQLYNYSVNIHSRANNEDTGRGARWNLLLH